jgi:hypothetical protein
MRNPLVLASVPIACLTLVAALWACGSNSAAPPAPQQDAAPEAGGDSGSLPDVPEIPNPDGPTTHCLLDDKTDPFELCTLKPLLQEDLQYAYATGQGAATTWDAITSAPSGHSVGDDLALASMLSNYACSANFYGDSDLIAMVSATLPDLANVIETELPQAPSGYDGEVYFELRNAAAIYNYNNDTANAAKLTKLADDYGRAIAKTYAHAVPAYAPVPAEAGSDAAADAAGPGDGGLADAVASSDASDAGAAPGLVIGVPVGADISYAPDQVVTAAAALLDMAVAHAIDPDAGAERAAWQATATAAIDYVFRRGRDPATGLFFQSLVTSGDPGHDALGAGSPTPDTLLTDVQAAVVLGLGRAQQRLNTLLSLEDAGADAATLPSSGYLGQADDLVGALVAAGLWDGSTATGSDPGAFLEGLITVPGGSPVLLTNKPTFGNAYLLGGVVRILAGSSTNNGFLIGHLIAALAQTMPANSSLLTAVTDMQGHVIQQGYLDATSRAFSLPVAFAADGGVVGPESPTPQYRTAALAAVIEAFTQRWRERANAPMCGL